VLKLNNQKARLELSKTSVMEFEALETFTMASHVPKVADKIKKNCILAKYDKACCAKCMTNQVSTITKGEISPSKSILNIIASSSIA
jgi:hypothetical protein